MPCAEESTGISAGSPSLTYWNGSSLSSPARAGVGHRLRRSGQALQRDRDSLHLCWQDPSAKVQVCCPSLCQFVDIDPLWLHHPLPGLRGPIRRLWKGKNEDLENARPTACKRWSRASRQGAGKGESHRFARFTLDGDYPSSGMAYNSVNIQRSPRLAPQGWSTLTALLSR